jgi:hypothetical protein
VKSPSKYILHRTGKYNPKIHIETQMTQMSKKSNVGAKRATEIKQYLISKSTTKPQ